MSAEYQALEKKQATSETNETPQTNGPQLQYDHSETPAHGIETLNDLTDRDVNNVDQKLATDDVVQQYYEQVKIILQVVNGNERLAILSKLKPPILNNGTEYEKIVRFSSHFQGTTSYGEYTIGVFGGYDVAVVQTDQGDKCRYLIEATIDLFPKAEWIIGVGVAYGGNKDKSCLGDVLVSSQIEEFSVVKFKDKKIKNRGDRLQVPDMIHTRFGKGFEIFNNRFACTKGDPCRFANVHVGCIMSWSALIDDETVKSRMWANSEEAIGGEMEGLILMSIIKRRERRLQATIIKGVSDYGDNTKDKIWQLTAALAAVEYTHFRLELTKGTLFSKAPVFQHPPTPNKPFGEDPSDGRASHRSRQQQQMDQIDGVQSHEQLNNDYTPLQDKDHTEVFEFTKTACSEWKCIGRVLGFTEDALSAIVREPGQTREEDYYAAMLRKWLDWARPNHDTPTVQRLSVALRKVGKEMLALCLERKYRMHTS